ncbi:MAG: hypothetical protein HY924_10305 [Elusimicrobia bacterium]|nr:hypothetical protein [Elusimicrobiota bacterium]
MSRLKDLMADHCEHCPVCSRTREHPGSWFARLVEWHGTWCPFRKAWREHYGRSSPHSRP